MRLITIILAVLLLLIQYPLWLGKGGFFRVRELSLQLENARLKNEESRLKNAKLASEVRDLEVGTEAIEERARYELGMIKKDEIFVQVIDASKIPEKDRQVIDRFGLAVPQQKPQAQAQPPAAVAQQNAKPAAEGRKSEKPAAKPASPAASQPAKPGGKPAAKPSTGATVKPAAQTSAAAQKKTAP